MSYCVRLLTPSERIVPYREILEQVDSLKLAAGSVEAWEKLEIYGPDDKLLSILERYSVGSDVRAGIELAKLRESLQKSEPTSAREWVKKYLSKVKTVYSFQLYPENITREGWPILGRIQNFLKDSLTGIIQADNEGYYNESGEYILWQMYPGAAGSIPAATLDENENWVAYQLKLDEKSIERFKQGTLPRKGFLDRIFSK
ncbi:MAG: hypothetical protein PHU23_14270 [Dehalococcoidales bacterium]|nr:hypothetical protein [Dehalococcoidales bacterium]